MEGAHIRNDHLLRALGCQNIICILENLQQSFPAQFKPSALECLQDSLALKDLGFTLQAHKSSCYTGIKCMSEPDQCAINKGLKRSKQLINQIYTSPVDFNHFIQVFWEKVYLLTS